jgi:hypothetical protein
VREKTLKIGGNPYRITGLDARQSQEFLQHAAKEMPDPLDEVIAMALKLPEGKFRDAFMEKQIDKAMERKRLRGCVNDPDLEPYLRSPQGLPLMKRLFGMMFRKHHSFPSGEPHGGF